MVRERSWAGNLGSTIHTRDGLLVLRIGIVSDLTANEVYPPDVYSTLRHYRTGDDALDRVAEALVRRYRGKPAAIVRIWRAVPRGVRTINSGDWVTIVEGYALQHAMADDPADDMPVIHADVPAGVVFTNGDSLLEWGYAGTRST